MCMNLNEDLSLWSEKPFRKSTPRKMLWKAAAWPCAGQGAESLLWSSNWWVYMGHRAPLNSKTSRQVDLEALRASQTYCSLKAAHEEFLDYMMAVMPIDTLHLIADENSLPILLLYNLSFSFSSQGTTAKKKKKELKHSLFIPFNSQVFIDFQFVGRNCRRYLQKENSSLYVASG